MKIIVALVLLILSFLGLIFLGMDVDERAKRNQIIPHPILAYLFGAAIICGVVIGISCTFIFINF